MYQNFVSAVEGREGNVQTPSWKLEPYGSLNKFVKRILLIFRLAHPRWLKILIRYAKNLSKRLSHHFNRQSHHLVRF